MTVNKLSVSETVGLGHAGRRAAKREIAELDLLEQLLAEQRRTNQLLEWLGQVIQQQQPKA